MGEKVTEPLENIGQQIATGLCAKMPCVIHVERVEGGFTVSMWGGEGQQRRAVASGPQKLARFVRTWAEQAEKDAANG